MSATAEEIRVRRLSDLEALVFHVDRDHRVAAYSSIVAAPEKALALEDDIGKDVVELLLGAYARTASIEERRPLLAALGQFGDPRVQAFVRNLLATEVADELLHLAARYFATSRDGLDADFLRALLRDDSSLSRIRIAASLLQPSEVRETADGVRFAAFRDDGVAFPPVSASTVAEWMDVLGGPIGEPLLLRLEAEGPDFAAWAAVWPVVDSWFQHWLVRQACRTTPAEEEIIRLGLDSEDEAVVAATVSALALYRPARSAALTARLPARN